MTREELIKKEAEKLHQEYLNGSKNWRKRHSERSTFEKCLKIAENMWKAGYIREPAQIKVNSKSEFKFEESKMTSQYTSYRAYLVARCEALPRQLEKKFDCSANWIGSRCRGMSNYIEISKKDSDDSITIRISDHEPTGSGSPCDFYIYIQDRTWMEIKKEVFEIAEDFLK